MHYVVWRDCMEGINVERASDYREAVEIAESLPPGSEWEIL